MPQVITHQQVLHLLQAIKSPAHRTCFAIMYACGLRITEAQTLTIKNIDSQQGILRIIGKGNKERVVPLPASMLANLRALWLLHRNPLLIFPNQQGDRPITTCILYRTFQDAKLKAGLPDNVTPHTLRHCYATRLMENKVDIRVVQILLGHASIQSTTIYTHLTEPTGQALRGVLDRVMADL